MRHICIACHHTEEGVEPIARDGWVIDPFLGATYGRSTVKVTGRALMMLYALAASQASVTAKQLRSAIRIVETNHDAAMYANSISYICHKARIPDPIRVIADGIAFAWAVPTNFSRKHGTY